jgi:hypothetical protein
MKAFRKKEPWYGISYVVIIKIIGGNVWSGSRAANLNDGRGRPFIPGGDQRETALKITYPLGLYAYRPLAKRLLGFN